MNFQQLRIVRETVRQRFNLTEAANVLLTSQSGVSKHIRDLEDELGFELFVRRGKRLLGLTDPGREVAAVIERILLETQNLEELSSSIAQRACGTLVIATTHTQARYSLPGVIAEFKKDFPDVRLTLKQLSPKDIASVLLEGLADVGIATDTLEHNPQILTFPFYSWEHVIVVPKSHPLARRKKVTLEDIAPYPIITYDEGLTGRARIDDAFQKASLVADVAMSALDADVIKAMSSLTWEWASLRPWRSTRSAIRTWPASRFRGSSRATRRASRCGGDGFCARMSIASSKCAPPTSPRPRFALRNAPRLPD